MRSPPPTVQLQDARLCYDRTTVLDDLSLSLKGGCWTGLLGRSGVGKTSLLRYIAGLTSDADVAGSVHCSDGGPLTSRIAYMAQSDLLLPWLSVLDNVMLGFRLRKQSATPADAKARALALLEQVGLAERAADLPAKLSGGMRQRTALARTLMEDRPVVLMDEPFSALDAITRYRLQELAAKLLAGRTIFLVTHDPLEALRLCDQVFVLAGPPTVLHGPLEPAGKAPRPLDDPGLVAQQREILDLLLSGSAAA